MTKNSPLRTVLPFAIFFVLVAVTGFVQSWTVALTIMNMCLVSAIMALGVNVQWGYAGLVNFGVMGFTALGGVAVVIVAVPTVDAAWEVGGPGVLFGLFVLLATAAVTVAARRLVSGRIAKALLTVVLVVAGLWAGMEVLGPSIEAVEGVNPAMEGYLGGMGLPVLLAWVVGGLLAAAAAFVIGKIALGLRADYLAIATLGVSEIIIAVLMNEDWLARGVKNVVGLPRPVPYEVDMRTTEWFQSLVETLGMPAIPLSSMVVKLGYIGLFVVVLGLILWLAERALASPWGRTMRAVRDNETAANAMGKDVKRLHLLVFVVGSGLIGVAGAMLVTLDGQFVPTAYQPLRFTFLIWVMVIVGGAGNNWGATVGAFIIWFAWVEAEPVGTFLIDWATRGLGDGSSIRQHLLQNASHMRYIVMGVLLLVVLRFAPRGIIPETDRT